MVIKVPPPVGAAAETVAPGWQFPGSGWRLVEVRKQEGECEECGRPLRTVYVVVDPAGHQKMVGRGCVKDLTGWNLPEAEARRYLQIAERDQQRALVWARFVRERPDAAATIQADIEAYEQRAPASAGAGASHEIRDLISDLYETERDWVLQIVARYRERRVNFWWVRNG